MIREELVKSFDHIIIERFRRSKAFGTSTLERLLGIRRLLIFILHTSFIPLYLPNEGA